MKIDKALTFAMVIILILGLFVVIYPIFETYAEKAELTTNAIQQDSVEIWWNDNSHPEIVPVLFVSDSLTVTQYVDVQIRQSNQVITQATHFVSNGYPNIGVDLAEIVNYQFDLQPGSYNVYCRLRIEVIANTLAVGTNENDLQLTNERTFYGTAIDDNGQIVQADSNNYSLCNTYSIGYKYYLPVIYK